MTVWSVVGAEASINGETNVDGLAGNMANQVSGSAENVLADMMHEPGAIIKVKQTRSAEKGTRNLIGFVRPALLK